MPGRTEQQYKEHRQRQPAQSKSVRPIHTVAGIADPGPPVAHLESPLHGPASTMPATALNRGRFQIGTFFFNSSTIHWVARKPSLRCLLATRKKSDASPTAINPMR